MSTLAPSTIDELSEVVRTTESLNIIGTDSKRTWRIPSDRSSTAISTTALRTIEPHPSDQIAVVGAGTSMKSLTCALMDVGQCVPIAEGNHPLAGTIGGHVSMNFPHSREAEHGSWRDWILGMQVMLADGTLVRSGSKVVKSVAGYDVHKLMIGARGTLGIIVSITLRTYPATHLAHRKVHRGPAMMRLEDRGADLYEWVQRTRASDFARAVEATGESLLEANWPSSTLWALVSAEEQLPRYPHDWVVRTGCREKNIEITDPTQIALMRRAKDIFDPTHKLNPGEMGIF